MKTKTFAIKGIIESMAIGLLCAIMPLVGWTKYKLDGTMISCDLEWNGKTPSVIMYNLLVIILVYIMPFISFFVMNSKIYIIVCIHVFY
jgi:hypothetical protein